MQAINFELDKQNDANNGCSQVDTYKTGRKNIDEVVINFYYFIEYEMSAEPRLKSCSVFNSALRSLSKVVVESNATTESEILMELSTAMDILMMNLSTEEFFEKIASKHGVTNISVVPFCRIFETSLLKLIMVESGNLAEEANLVEFKKKLSERTNNFISNLNKGTQKIMNLSLSLFTKDRMAILTFGYSEIIEILLENAREKYNKHYSILIVVPNIDNSKEFSTRKELMSYHHKNILEWKTRMRSNDISVKLLSIDSIYNAINAVDFVLLKPECILESGSVIGISGTAVISAIANSVFYKPVYFVTHAAKFVNMVPMEMKINNVVSEITYQNPKSLSCPINSIFDLSDSSHITMFLTDIGAITPQNIAFETKQLFL
ncbi:translation initiation factor EIFb alpha subunit [Cryptosporidium bovis]|uniref:translation initiation factor EIFb alpha subunit n=1 Tax=Cryptosporidium bovis TaxID=310047 RepID=UPI00351A2E2F|nr:translation initiation factor EIFb alpha subunit [Cryptosporidium bovis]